MQHLVDISWSCTPTNWSKLNSDGSFFPRLATTGVGVVIRDEQGVFQGGLSFPIYYGTVLLAYGL